MTRSSKESTRNSKELTRSFKEFSGADKNFKRIGKDLMVGHTYAPSTKANWAPKPISVKEWVCAGYAPDPKRNPGGRQGIPP